MRRFFLRLTNYHKKHGLNVLLRRTIQIVYRKIFKKNFILFYSDLSNLNLESLSRNDSIFSLVKYKNIENIPEDYLNIVFHFRYKNVFNNHINERFKHGATLWCINYANSFSGFIWSIEKNPIEKYFFPLTESDVHLFDNEIFERYRGQGINKYLIQGVLQKLKDMGYTKAYIETAEWNIPEIRSLSKTPFEKLAVIRKANLFGKIFTIWEAIE